MTTQQKQAETKKAAKAPTIASQEKLEHTESHAAPTIKLAVVNGDSQTNIDSKKDLDVKEVDSKPKLKGIQAQLNQFKLELIERVETIKVQLRTSQQDLIKLSHTVKAEFNEIVNDFTKLGADLKTDVSEISTKHKTHLSETLKQSKAHTLEVWGKLKS